MTRKVLAVSLVVLVGLSATAFAGNSAREVRSKASVQCSAVQAKIGPFWFDHAFASFGECVSALTPLARQNTSAAAASCRSERASAAFAATHGGKTFARFYGVGRKGKHAFDRCVSAKERTASVAITSAASTCEAAQAFAACISAKARGPFTVSPVQPTPAATPKQELKGGTVGGGCAPPENGDMPHPLIASCQGLR